MKTLRKVSAIMYFEVLLKSTLIFMKNTKIPIYKISPIIR